MAPTTKHQSSRNETNNVPILSRSASTASNHGPLRPKSRASTASLQSVGIGNAFQPVQNPSVTHHSIPIEQPSFQYPAPHQDQHYQAYSHPVDPNAGTYHQHMHPMQPPQMASHHLPLQDMRPMSSQGYHEAQHAGMYGQAPPYGLHQQHIQHHHVRHVSEQYEGSPAPEDSNNEGGAKRRKGAASSMANDQELRRLLASNEGKTLKEIAQEVQKNEGSTGKSEKAKQVFAMLWLKETCQRSSNSVRRDRVFARYTERCGNERVPTLNPASFGKLVRIIFPNVQTRRLGVRGESKYHYVDLSLVPEENGDPGYDTFDRPVTSAFATDISVTSQPQSALTRARPSLENAPSRLSIDSVAMETADFPAPTNTYHTHLSTVVQQTERIPPTMQKLDCKYLSASLIRVAKGNMSAQVIAALPAVRPNMPATLPTYLAMPTTATLCQPIPQSTDSPIELPMISDYLQDDPHDHHVAKLLSDLYRSYCIDVIDAFRKCKDKSFFNHHQAFNGKMTVPVSKLFNLPSLAAWIQECDMRMYKAILRYMTPLVLQDVPAPVWQSFDKISAKLVIFLASCYEEKCPPHVVAAKVIPAARFTNLLKRLRQAQTAAIQVSRVLEGARERTQMWLDICAGLDPEFLLQESIPPPESISQVAGIIKQDLRIILQPDPVNLVMAAEADPHSSFSSFLRDPAPLPGVLAGEQYTPDVLTRLVRWLEHLPSVFVAHHPQCLRDWLTRFFRAIMNQFGANGSISYQSWWYLENFCHLMLSFMTELEGLLLPAPAQAEFDAREAEKSAEHVRLGLHNQTSPALSQGEKRKRNSEEFNAEGEARAIKSPASRPQTANTDGHENDTDAEDDHDQMPRTNSPFPTIVEPVTEMTTDELEAHLTEVNGNDHHNDQQLHVHSHPPIPGFGSDDPDLAELGGPLDLPHYRTGLTSPLKAPFATPARLTGHNMTLRNSPAANLKFPSNNSHLHGNEHPDDSGIGLDLTTGLTPMTADRKMLNKQFKGSDWFLSSDPVDPVAGHQTRQTVSS